MTLRAPILWAILLGLHTLASADEAARQRAEALMQRSFSGATQQEWDTRLRQDETQTLCSVHRNLPPPEVAQRVLQLQRESIRYPDDGRLMGDWREGEKLAAIGTGGHIGKLQPDRPGTRKGGNCYACHALAKKEVAAGNLGPALTGFGNRRGRSAESIKYTYDKIYNAQAFAPCSMMPRFGHNGWLTPQEIADAVAFLLDPASPVNQ